MTKPWVARPEGAVLSDARIMLCTGERMEELLLRLFRPAGVRTTALDVQHRNGLANKFFCYSNFEHGAVQWLKEGE